MKAMQSLVKIPEIQATMRMLSKEMMKAGIIEEMLEVTFESMDDQEEMEEAAEMEIDRILFEITAGALGKAPSKVTDALPEPEPLGGRLEVTVRAAALAPPSMVCRRSTSSRPPVWPLFTFSAPARPCRSRSEAAMAVTRAQTGRPSRRAEVAPD